MKLTKLELSGFKSFADTVTLDFGHGVTAAPEDRWYWQRSLVDPNALGANELRRLWLDSIRSLLD